MADKVQLIKQEIEKRRQLIWPKNTGEMKVVDTPKQLIQGWLNCLKWIEDFIDSLPEPASEDLEEEIYNYIKDNFFGSKSMGFLSNRTKEELDSVDVANIARHFAEWQNHQMKETLQTEYEKGQFDMREEMIKDALSGQIYKSHDGDVKILAVKGNTDKLYRGTDIKFIIVKEE